MRAMMKEKLDQAKQELRERKDKRNVYVRNWREGQRTQRRISIFVEEYVREKFNDVYSEALSFYTALDKLYPEKKDLRRTKEFRSWRGALSDGNNNEILTPVTTLNEGDQNRIHATRITHQAEQQLSDNLVLRIPLLPRLSTTQTPPRENPTVEIPQLETLPPQLETQPEITDEITVEIPQLETPPEITDEITVEIPPSQLATPPEIGAEFTVEMPPLQFETPPETDDQITDRRIREIIEELRNDPGLNGIFDDPQPAEQTDEGIEVPSIEEEMEVDIGLVDYDPDFYAWS